MYELIIVGGGPAGLTAAVYAARKRIETLLLSEDLGGQVNQTAGVENYMGYQFIQGPELMQKFEEQVEHFPIQQQIGLRAEKVLKATKGFQVQTDRGESYEGKVVMVATGKRSRKLNVPGEKEYLGRGVTYCAICDGPFFAGKKVAVIGGGNSALEAALDMIKIGEWVYLVSLSSLTGDSILIDQVKAASNITILTEHEVLEIEGETFVTSCKIRDLKTQEESKLDVAGVFVEIGLIPNSELVSGLTSLNEQKEIVVSPSCETDVPGLFAAGDVTDVPEKQIVVAAGEGAKAALQAHRYLQRHSQPAEAPGRER